MSVEIQKIHKSEYPYLLQQISSLPECLYVAGTIPPDDMKFLCVIGSRKYSNYGEEVCRSIIHGLKGYPVVIVSGLALGIDSIAHEVALEADLKTIAFPGSGLLPEVIYPQCHLGLANRIVESGGALISPFEMDNAGGLWTFPFRNRLMAGISHATLLVEGRRGSGTLITANNANEFCRDVFVIPGSIFSDLSYGAHTLLRQGATAVSSSEDVLESLGFEVNRYEPPIEKKKRPWISKYWASKNESNGNAKNENQDSTDEETRQLSTDNLFEHTINSSGSIMYQDSLHAQKRDTPSDTINKLFPNDPPINNQNPTILLKEKVPLQSPKSPQNHFNHPNLNELSLNNNERKLIEIIRSQWQNTSQLIERMNLNPTELSIIISELELRGIIQETGGLYMTKF